MKLFVAAIIKNEMDALLEWIAYHRVVGVSGFIIADNGSNDGSRAFLDGLERLGIVTVLDFPDVVGQKPQLPAYERILRSCSEDIDLLAFIDADEFLVPLDPEQSIATSLDKWFSDPPSVLSP
ncbi:glycosyltransferase family 2 protein [Klebsiella michiganensis]|uniref:glycosyltransferase family 2 protein n=1 Tax=Klebsiella michiganensis TaxID=1134687 RepID=UPI001D0EC7E8|nr:glycosyltransferase family 2 protein [Klebsiella michiganensis]